MVVYFFTDSLNPIISSFCDTLLFISLFTHQVKKGSVKNYPFYCSKILLKP